MMIKSYVYKIVKMVYKLRTTKYAREIVCVCVCVYAKLTRQGPVTILENPFKSIAHLAKGRMGIITQILYLINTKIIEEYFQVRA